MTMINVCVCCCVLILFDIVSGIISAAKNNELSSSIMRDGLYAKTGEILLLAMSAFLARAIAMPPFDSLGIPTEILYSVGAYIALMEILSIIENVCKINPDIPFSKILLIFNLDIDKSDKDSVVSESAPEK